MGTVVRLFQRSTKPTQTSADLSQGDAVRISPRVALDQIVLAASTCETLSHAIDVLQRSLTRLDGIVDMIGHRETREELQHQTKSIEALLLRESARLSSIKHAIQATFH
jgi:hypothetical protein